MSAIAIANITIAVAKPKKIWVLSPHTRVKHLILKYYLDAWLPKLAWKGRVVFIDGFAGPGEYAAGEPGSPRIALDAAINHTGDLAKCELVYLFVERERARHEHLAKLLEGIDRPSNMKLQAIPGEFADKLGEILDDLDAADKNMAPAFIMIDPFGFKGVPFNLIARAARQPRSEFLISFMYDPVVRWRNHPDHEETFDTLFGCPDWRRADEFGSADERKRFLLDLYVSQLRSAGLSHVLAFEMMDEDNRTEYFLIYGTHSLDGLRAMKGAMWRVDPSGRFRFSDASVSNQLELIKPGPDFGRLKEMILVRFSGRQFSVEELEEFVLVETPFRESHYKTQILRPLELEEKLSIVRSTRKKRFAYPPGTVMRLAETGT